MMDLNEGLTTELRPQPIHFGAISDSEIKARQRIHFGALACLPCTSQSLITAKIRWWTWPHSLNIGSSNNLARHLGLNEREFLCKLVRHCVIFFWALRWRQPAKMHNAWCNNTKDEVNCTKKSQIVYHKRILLSQNKKKQQLVTMSKVIKRT